MHYKGTEDTPLYALSVRVGHYWVLRVNYLFLSPFPNNIFLSRRI